MNIPQSQAVLSGFDFPHTRPTEVIGNRFICTVRLWTKVIFN